MSSQEEPIMIRSLESDSRRKTQMVDSFRQALEAETKGKGHVARLAWLLSHVRDYLDRWSACLRFFSMADFLHNDLHVVLKIGVEITEQEQRTLPLPARFKERWEEFSNAIRGIDANTSKGIAAELWRRFENVHNELVMMEGIEKE